ncbi:MAG: YeeE/YedE thiosulfate transporter family protein [Halanaerobiaceae bacterium]
MDFLFYTNWSPYIVGIGIGILSWLSFLISRKALGTSTAYVRTCGMIAKKINESFTKENEYFKIKTPEIDWQWMLVLGIVIGSFISANLSGQFEISWLPVTEFDSILNLTITGRLISAFIGGILLGFGSRWANGCTSGHGISGTLQLSISSWIAVISFFIGGVITAFIIF